MTQPWEIYLSISVLASSMLCPKAVTTASCTAVALPQETCLPRAVSLLAPCWFPSQQVPEKIWWLQGFCLILEIFSHSSLLTQSWVMSPAGKGEKTLCPDSIIGRSSQWNMKKKLLGGTSKAILMPWFSSFVLPKNECDDWSSSSLIGTMREMQRETLVWHP